MSSPSDSSELDTGDNEATPFAISDRAINPRDKLARRLQEGAGFPEKGKTQPLGGSKEKKKQYYG